MRFMYFSAGKDRGTAPVPLGFLLVVAAVAQSPPPPFTKGCGAGLEAGDIYVRCAVIKAGVIKREHVRLTHTGDIKSWGITPDGTLLAFARGRPNVDRELRVLDLRTRQTIKSEPTDQRSRVDPTCGTLLFSEFWIKDSTSGYTFHDLVENKEMPVPPSTRGLRCSGDRRYTLRLANYDELYLDSPQPSRIAKGVEYFNISPDGEHLAYSQGDQLCAGSREEVQRDKASCLGMTWTAGPMVVLSDGRVLFTEQTGQACKFDSNGELSESGELSDPCPAIFGWKPGEPNDQLLSFKDSDPHVISTDTGLHVIELSRKWKEKGKGP